MLSPTVLLANKKIEDVNDFLHQKGVSIVTIIH